MLSDQEHLRYEKQLTLPSFGAEGQSKLKNTSILVIGTGGLGCSALQSLASMGVGTLGICDGDVVEMSNLHRQHLYTQEDVGSLKAIVAQSKLQKINPHVHYQAYPTHFTLDSSALLQEYEVIIDGTDNFAAKYMINDLCLEHKKPWVYASIHHHKAQLALFDSNLCYRCLFPKPPPIDALPPCSSAGVLGVLPPIVGHMQAYQAVQYLLGIEQKKLTTIDFGTWKMQSYHLATSHKHPHEVPTESFEISEEQLQEMDDVSLIDIRFLNEEQIRKQIDQSPSENRVVLFCQRGIKSAHVVQNLRQQKNMEHVYSLKPSTSTF